MTLLAFLGIGGLCNVLGFSENISLILLGIIFWFLWYSAYIIPYPDGKKMFYHFFIFSIFLWIINTLLLNISTPRSILFIGISIWLLALLVFVFIVGSFYDLGENFDNHVTIVGLIWIFFLIFFLSNSSLGAIIINLAILLVFLKIFHYIQSSPFPIEHKKEIQIRDLLDGEKILGKKEKKQKQIPEFFLSLKQTSPVMRISLELSNILLFLLLIGFYFYELFHNSSIIGGYYWVGIILFVGNSIFLKKNQIFGDLSRFSVAGIINFSIFLGMMILGEEGLKETLPRLIARNIFCGILIFYSQIKSIKKYINQKDLISWSIATGLATIVNLFLLIQSQLSGQLLFSLGFLYLGVQGFIGYYSIKIISKLSGESEDTKKTDNTPSNSHSPKDHLDEIIMSTIEREKSI